MKKIFSLFMLLFFISTIAVAGGDKKVRKIEGTVTNKQGEPLVGAKIIVLGTDKEIYTDFEGHFSLEGIPASSKKVKISHISYLDKTQTLDFDKLNGETELKFHLLSK